MENRHSKSYIGHCRQTLTPSFCSGHLHLYTAFSLVELLIVVAILGILAAIVVPEFQNHAQLAKEAAAKDSLRLYRDTIERYALTHNGVPPGYANNNISEGISEPAFATQTKESGLLSDYPINPFNSEFSVSIIADGQAFPAAATGSSGWIYKPQTREFRLDWPGTDSTGKAFFEY